jgi:preprotein translocase subunit SecG
VNKELNPGIVAAVIVVLVIIVAVFLYRGANTGGGSKAPGEVGNSGPFAPGGAANSHAEPKKH